MSIAESMQAMEAQGFFIHAGSVHVLDRAQCLWVAQVTTEERQDARKGRYALLVRGAAYMLLSGEHLPALGQWCFEQARKL